MPAPSVPPVPPVPPAPAPPTPTPTDWERLVSPFARIPSRPGTRPPAPAPQDDPSARAALDALHTAARFAAEHRVPHALGLHGPAPAPCRAVAEGFLADLAKTSRPFQLLSGSPAPSLLGAASPRLPVRLLASLLHVPARLPPDDARAQVTSTLAHLTAPPDAPPEATPSALLSALGLSPDSGSASAQPVLEQRLLGALPPLLRTMARSASLVLWLDGYDLLDASERAWLHALLSHLPQAPLLLILTAPDADALEPTRWQGAGVVFRGLRLQTQATQASAQHPALPSGDPSHHPTDPAADHPADLAADIAADQTSAQPPSAAMLAAHLDDLPPESLHILRFAALASEPFPLDDLLAMLRLSPLSDEQPWFDDPRPPWLQQRVADLRDRGLLRRCDPAPPTASAASPAPASGRLTWALTHPSLAPMILSEMDATLQRAAHACLSRVLSARGAATLTVARHLHAAGLVKQAAALRLTAAQDAARARRHRDALDLQAQALAALGPEDGPLYLATLHDHGHRLLALGRAPDALPLLAHQLQVAFALQDRPASLRAYLDLATCRRALGDALGAQLAATRCLDLCDRPDFAPPPPLTAPTARALFAASVFALGQPRACSEALKSLEPALERLRALPPSLPLLDALWLLARLRIARAELSTAAAPLDEAFALLPQLEASADPTADLTADPLPDTPAAPLRLRALRCRLLGTYARLLSLLGQHAPAHARLQQATAAAKEDDLLPDVRAELLRAVALRSLDLGDPAHALRTLSRAHTLSTTRDRAQRAALHRAVARAHAASGNPDDARKHLDRAQHLAAKSPHRLASARVTLLRATLAAQTPRLPQTPPSVEVRDLFLQAISAFEDAGHWLGTAQALSAYAAFLSSHNLHADALRCTNRARALAPLLKLSTPAERP